MLFRSRVYDSHLHGVSDVAVMHIRRIVGIQDLCGFSSEDQLESLKERLFLRIYRLTSTTGSPNARTLNQIVQEVEDRLSPDAVVELDRKLAARSYAPLPDYDEQSFTISEIQTYLVGETFPRIIRSRLDVGIRGVNYEIELEHIATFECESDEVFKEQ